MMQTPIEACRLALKLISMGKSLFPNSPHKSQYDKKRVAPPHSRFIPIGVGVEGRNELDDETQRTRKGRVGYGRRS